MAKRYDRIKNLKYTKFYIKYLLFSAVYVYNKHGNVGERDANKLQGGAFPQGGGKWGGEWWRLGKGFRRTYNTFFLEAEIPKKVWENIGLLNSR